MEVENAEGIAFVEKFLAEYARGFVRTLFHPIARFQPLQMTSITDMSGGSLDVISALGDPHSWLHPAAAVLISIVLGLIINLFVPARKYSCDIEGKVFALSFIWLYVVAYTHVVCRIFRGKATLTQTLWVSLQVCAPLFVVSSFINLVGGLFVMQPRVSSLLVSSGKIGNSIANNSAYIYFLAQFALLNVYLPLGVKSINGFGCIRAVMLAVALSLFWVVFWLLFSIDINVDVFL